ITHLASTNSVALTLRTDRRLSSLDAGSCARNSTMERYRHNNKSAAEFVDRMIHLTEPPEILPATCAEIKPGYNCAGHGRMGRRPLLRCFALERGRGIPLLHVAQLHFAPPKGNPPSHEPRAGPLCDD